MMQKKQHTATQPIIYVGISRRIGAFAYDLILLIALLILAAGIVMPFTKGAVAAGNIFFQIYIFLVIFLFFGWFWTHGGQTLGMRAWKIRVELNTGKNLNWSQAGLRFILAIMTFGIGLLWCLWDEKHRSFYDLLAKTQVIKVEKRYVPTTGIF